jgi:hypothetical protein
MRSSIYWYIPGEMMFIHEICKAFQKEHIPYAIVGGYAVALHGAVRGTVDIDVVLKWTKSNLKKIVKTLNELGLVSRLPLDPESVFHFREEYIKNRNLIAWNFYDPKNPLHQVDIIITYDLEGAKVDHFKTPLGNISVLSLNDLIEMKRASGRTQDIEDIKTLENL